MAPGSDSPQMALYRAVETGRTEDVVQVLKESPNAVALAESLGLRPLHRAISDGKGDLVAILLQHGATLNLPDEDGALPIDLAAISGRRRIVDQLLQHGARLSIHSAAALGRLSDLEAILDLNPDSVRARIGGWTALHWAVMCGHIESAKKLLAHRADPNAKGEFGLSPLHVAVMLSDVDQPVVVGMTKLLIDAGAALTNRDSGGQTPLHRAAQAGNDAAVQLLLENKADAGAKNNAGKIPLVDGADAGHDKVVRLLLKAAPPLEDRNAALNAASTKGRTLAVKTLLNSGAEANSVVAGRSALHMAVLNGHTETVDALLQHGATPRIRDDRGNTPLHYAARDGRIGICKLLLRAGASPASVNDDGDTPRDLARQFEHEDIVTYLSTGGDPT